MTATEDAGLVDAMNAGMAHMIPTAHQMGLTVIEARRGYAGTSVPLAGNGNHFGVMYAGVLFTAAEILGGIIAVASFDSSKFFPLVKGIDISFVGMAKSDVRAEARLDDATIDRVAREAEANGKSDFTLDAVVRDADRQQVATTHGLYQLRAHAR